MCNRASFDEFWAVWPNRIAKAAAEKAWKKLSQPDRLSAIESAPRWFASWRKQHPDASGIHPATYLNQQRWKDEALSQPSNRYQQKLADLRQRNSNHTH